MNNNQMDINNKKFTETSNVFDRLKYAALNATIQFKAAKKSLDDIEKMANQLGFDVDESGKLQLKKII